MVVPLDALFSRSVRQQVRLIACGKAHSIILAQVDGRSMLYAFGSNKFGQLGVGKNVPVSIEPSLVKLSNV